MKKLIFTAVLIFAAHVMADPVTFQWNQDTPSLASLSHWSLKVRSTPDGEIENAIDVPYSGEVEPSYTSTQTITVVGTPGSTVRKFFTVTAWSKNGQESGESNQIFKDFVVPWDDVKVPVQFTITIQ